MSNVEVLMNREGHEVREGEKKKCEVEQRLAISIVGE